MSNQDFEYINYMGFEILMHIPTKTFNYTKFCKQLKNSNDHNIFRKLVGNNIRLWEIIMSYEKNKIDHLRSRPRSIQTLIDAGIFYKFNHGIKPTYFGTYGPKYLFLFLVLNLNINEYIKFMNYIINSYDQNEISSTGIELPDFNYHN